MMDPPEQTRYRRLLAKYFSVRRIRARAGVIEQIATELLDRIAETGPPADLVTDYAVPLTSRGICTMLGISEDDRAAAREHINNVFAITVTPEQAFPTIMGIGKAMQRPVAECQRNPGADTVSDLLAREDLSVDKVRAVASVLAAGGMDTSVNMMALGTLTLVRHPEQLARLQEDPALFESSVDELLRYPTISQWGALRRALTYVEIGGQLIREGELVVVTLNSANRDERHFDEPNRLDLSRRQSDHVAFGFGPHQCIGRNLARSGPRADQPVDTLADAVHPLSCIGTARRSPDAARHDALRAACATGEPAALKNAGLPPGPAPQPGLSPQRLPTTPTPVPKTGLAPRTPPVRTPVSKPMHARSVRLLNRLGKHVRRPRSDRQDATGVSTGDQGGPVGYLELPQHRTDVVLDTLPAQVQLGRELHRRLAGGDPLQNPGVELGQHLAPLDLHLLSGSGILRPKQQRDRVEPLRSEPDGDSSELAGEHGGRRPNGDYPLGEAVAAVGEPVEVPAQHRFCGGMQQVVEAATQNGVHGPVEVPGELAVSLFDPDVGSQACHAQTGSFEQQAAKGLTSQRFGRTLALRYGHSVGCGGGHILQSPSFQWWR
jgi:hypothetical protein